MCELHTQAFRSQGLASINTVTQYRHVLSKRQTLLKQKDY